MSESGSNLIKQIHGLSEMVQDLIKERLNVDPFWQQKVYENWTRKDDWLLRSEALPLTVGFDPDQWKEIRIEGFARQEEVTWESLSSLINDSQSDNLLKNHDQPDQWRVAVRSYYQWLQQQGINVPDALDSLMQFILSVVAKPKMEEQFNGISEQQGDPAFLVPQSQSADREKILGAALNIVAKEPHQCQNESGLINGLKLAELISSQSVLWFEAGKSPMAKEDMAIFLEKWLE